MAHRILALQILGGVGFAPERVTHKADMPLRDELAHRVADEPLELGDAARSEGEVRDPAAAQGGVSGERLLAAENVA